MIGTELREQSEYFSENKNKQPPSFISDYSKVETKEESLIDPKDIKLEIYSKEIRKNVKVKPVNSDQLIPISIDKPKTYFYKRIGNTFSFFGNKNGDPLIIIGPHWPLYIVVIILLSFLNFGFLKYFWNGLPNLYKFTMILLYLIFNLSYTYTALINPGYPKHDNDSKNGEPRNKFFFCNICKLWVSRDKKTEHCYDCNICVEGNDHHCIWTGKCIGAKNLISFYIFVGSVFVMFGNLFFSISNIKVKK